MSEKPKDTTIKDYYYGDPFQKDLHGILVVPPMPKGSPEFTVVGWKDITDVLPGTHAYQAAQVWGAIASTLAYIINLGAYIKNWSTVANLVAIPRAGNQLNAYYDRSSLRFFWGRDPKTKKSIYTCDAVGIVAHELGHAILDAMRPDLWNTVALEFFAFHEAFGDILAIASVLQHDAVIKFMLAETTTPPDKIPDLWQSTVASRLAQELGHAIYYSSNMIIGADKYLRNSFNDFKYTNPNKLGHGSSDEVLSQEPHNFSRIFSGAWYQCFCELFKANYMTHDPPAAILAVKAARDTMIKALLDATLIAPTNLRFFNTIAALMIEILCKNGKKKEAELVKKVFLRRNLWTDAINTVPITDENLGKVKIDFLMDQTKPVILPDDTEIQMELPKWTNLFDGEDVRNLVRTSVSDFIDYAKRQNLLGDENDNNMFSITPDSKLVRNYICSSFRSLPQISLLGNLNQ